MTAPWKAPCFGFGYDHPIRAFWRDNHVDVGVLQFFGTISWFVTLTAVPVSAFLVGGKGVLPTLISLISFVIGLGTAWGLSSFLLATSRVSRILLIDSDLASFSREALQEKSRAYLYRRLGVLQILKQKSAELPGMAATDLLDLKEGIREEYGWFSDLGILPRLQSEELQGKELCEFRTMLQKSLQ